jgi:poly(beta-D-mannuronate) lyase
MTSRRSPYASRAVRLGVVLSVGGIWTMANAALQPPPGYFGAVKLEQGKSAACASPPAPVTGALDFPSKYEGSGKARDQLNAETDAQYKLETKPLTDMERGVSRLTTKYMATGDPAQLECVVVWLATWADAGALLGDATNHGGKALRKWTLGSLSGAYLRLKFSSSAPLAAYPEQAARIEAWFGAVADLVKPEWPPQDPLARINNHYYWAAWSLMATAVATGRQDLFDAAVVLFRVFSGQVDAEGFLPNELERASRAAQYQSYAMLPIAMLAAFGKANGVDLTVEGDDALVRFGQRVQILLEDPASVETKTATPQAADASSSSSWVWLEPYCWTVSCSPELQARLSSQRPLAATRLGGDLTAVFSDSAAPSAEITRGLKSLNAVCRTEIDRGDYGEALRVCKRIGLDAEKMAPGSDEHVAGLVNMGDIKALVGNYVDADSFYGAALALVDRTGVRDGNQAAQLLTKLVEFKVKRGKYLDAELMARRLLSIREKAAGAQDAGVAVVRVRYADLLAASRQFPQAEAAYAQAIAVLERGGVQTAPAHALAVQRLAEMYARRAQYKQAEAQYQRLLELVELRALGDALLATARQGLAYAREQQIPPIS